MSKQKKAKKIKYLTNCVPYNNCFVESGMIECPTGVYSHSYKIGLPTEASQEQFNTELVNEKMYAILSSLNGLKYQFSIRNSIIDKEAYLNSILLPEDKEGIINERIRAYNDMIRDNMDIGHNNSSRTIVLTVSKEAKSPDEAHSFFKELDEQIIQGFKDLYGYTASPMSLEDRLEFLYSFYSNPEPFGERVNFDGNGFSLKSMNRMKMTTKEVVAPTEYNVILKEKNIIHINGRYARVFFINSLPLPIPDSVLSDLTSVSSDSVLSVSYTPVDSKIGFYASNTNVEDNTERKVVQVRDTITDRKNHATRIDETAKEESEETYFDKKALDVFTDSAAKEQPVMLVTFLITLYADNLEDLERDTNLLMLSASKYVCQIKTCDLQQNEAFLSSLPLNDMRVNLSRAFPLDMLSGILSIDIHRLFEQIPTFQGLNGINDNLILLDRGNFPTGLITGIKHSGKSFAIKRAILNALISSNDEVVLITKDLRPYNNFITAVGGDKKPSPAIDPFMVDASYGLTETKDKLMHLYLKALLSVVSGYYRKRYTSDEADNFLKKIDTEALALSECNSLNDALNLAKEQHFEVFTDVFEDYYIDQIQIPSTRAKFVEVNDNADLLMTFNFFWNYALAMKKRNKNVWIFVESIDELLYSTSGSDYLISLIDKFEKMRCPLTLVIDDLVHIVTNDNAKIELDYLLNKVQYFEFLSQGPIERRILAEKLNISNTLLPYITDREPGEGIIITPTTNLSFNDRFENKDNEFYKVFY